MAKPRAVNPEPPPAAPPAAAGVDGARSLPAWFPGWAHALAEQYFSGTTCLFALHGNVHDLVPLGPGEGDGYGSLSEFLAARLFANRDVVLRYDLSHGLRAYAGSDAARLRAMHAKLDPRIGSPDTWPRDPDAVLALLDRLVQQQVMEPDPARRLGMAVLIEHVQFLVPSAELSQMAGPQGSRLLRFLSWAQSPYIKRNNIAFCLSADQLAEVNERLVGSAHVSTLAVPMPDTAAREAYAAWRAGADGKPGGLTPRQFAELTSGLNLVNLDRLLAQAGPTLDGDDLKRLKKGLIERETRGLVEFVEPSQTLDDFVGNDAVKRRLAEDGALLAKARLDAAPMGYLICGPVGTGKTYLAECFAGSVGVPCVKLRNFRSKYVGETEGNLERVLNVLRAMGPVVVVIDEADAALGTREASGDSGTSSRVFSMIAGQMGDTRYRGKLIWMLLTSRPDLLPIDLKRQGRAEVHLPLFAPGSDAEIRTMIGAMARKNKAGLEPDALPEGLAGRGLSGADIESIVLSAKRHALTNGRETIGREDLSRAIDDFIPSAQGLEKEKQELAAVLECTSKSFLPGDWRKKIEEPDGRAHLQERIAAIRHLIAD